MTHDAIRKNHFERLNAYRHSAEYAEYAKHIGAEVPEGDLPCLIGNRWEIDGDVHREFLEMLPPLGWRGNTFFMREFTFDDITAKFSKDGDKYYCEFSRYPERKQAPVETPWGIADSVTEIAPGIISYSTPSHGGIWLSPARVASMPKPLRDFVPFGGPQAGPGRWFEEDADWSVVCVAFPQFFKPEDIDAALRTLQHYKPELYRDVVAMREGRGA